MKSRSRAAIRTDLPKITPTSGKAFLDGTLLELISDRKTGNAGLLHWKNSNGTKVSHIVVGGSNYVPSPAASFFQHLPSSASSYGSTESLFLKVSDFAVKALAIPNDIAFFLSFVSFASFFSDCLTLSPSLLLSGSCITAMSVLRFLSCTCRHPILLADSRVQALPCDLQPTYLICNADLKLDRLLAALQFHGFGIVEREPRQINGTTAAYIGDMELRSPFADLGLWLPVPRSTHTFSVQDEERESELVDELQNQLLMYRLRNREKVRRAEFDVPDFVGSTRELGRTLGRCIVDAPALQKQALELLRSRAEAERTEGTNPFEAAVIEAMLVLCHERKATAHPGEVARLATKILGRYGESVEINAREAGGHDEEAWLPNHATRFRGSGNLSAERNLCTGSRAREGTCVTYRPKGLGRVP